MKHHTPAGWLTVFLAIPLPAQAVVSVTQANAPVPNIPLYDPNRAVVVTLENGRVWEWNGLRWNERLGSGLPSFPTIFAGAYDTVRNRLMWLTTAYSQPVQVLEWDGSQWLLRGAITTLVGVTGAAFDARRGRFVVLHSDPTQTTMRVAEWDGNQWSTIAPSSAPPARTGSAVAWDPVRQAVVCFGGVNAFSTLADTWTWDGTSFQQITGSIATPSTRSAASLCFDPFNNRMLLYGGVLNSTIFSDTWALDLAGWTQLQPTTSPGPRYGASLLQDRSGVMLSDGRDWLPNYMTWPPYSPSPWEVRPADPYWRWNGLTWQRLPADREPAALNTSATVWDEVRGEMLMIGKVGLAGEVWTWNGSWHRKQPTALPNGAMAPDPQRGSVVLFGGVTALNETWTWNGVDWTQRQPAHAPAPRMAHAMAYDRARNVVLLFGGTDGINTFGDFWQWNGIDWSQIQAPGGPGPRLCHAMGYDEARARTVVGPGLTLGGPQPWDTWEWDGTNWIATSVTVVPQAARGATSMTFDPAAGQLVMQAFQRYYWTGTDWVAASTFTQSGLLAGDPLRRGVLVVPVTWSPATARLQLLTSTPAAVTSANGGCALGTPPGLGAGSRPVPGAADFHFEVETPAYLAPVMLLAGLHSAQVPLGNGCVLMVGQPAVAQLSIASVAGWSWFPMPIPANQALLGLQLSAQAAVLDPLRSVFGGITISGGVQVTVGW